MRVLPGEPGNRVSKPVNRTGPAAVLRGPWVPRHFGGRPGGRMPGRAITVFDPGSPATLTLSNGTGRRATVANDVLGDMKQFG